MSVSPNVTYSSPAVAKTSAVDDVCCPKFDPATYTDEEGRPYKLISWDDKPFVKDGTYCCYYIPLAFGRGMTRASKKIDDYGAQVPKDEFMVLSDCHSPWYSNIFVTVAKNADVEGAQIEKISGTFLAKAFEGEYSNMGNWAREMQVLVKEMTEDKSTGDAKKVVETVDAKDMKIYFYYPTCPKCAQKHGKNHVVLYAKIS